MPKKQPSSEVPAEGGFGWPPSEEQRAEFRKLMNEMIAARLDMFAANAPKYAKALGTFRDALLESGFSEEDSMQIVLRVLEQLPGGRPPFPRRFGRHWRRD